MAVVSEPNYHNNPWDEGEFCSACGRKMVCMCGQTEPTRGWPCSHGGCDFHCEHCESGAVAAGNAMKT